VDREFTNDYCHVLLVSANMLDVHTASLGMLKDDETRTKE
jgi:hypothetical protein